ncbi:nuclear transport factor 2 family protein [Tsukamurella sp. NPDC003166]|uniref:nuclear transport factor 2 family protein n=1 Tax=Tsukamurella sp. NPDC003166 TaxID=3154444 RepID=UPI0033A0C2B5
MRPTDPRELLHPVLPAETYRRLGIAPPRPPQQFAPGGPVSSAGTPFVTGRAVTGVVPDPRPRAPLPAPSAPQPSAPRAHQPSAQAWQTAPSGPPRRDRSVAIVVGATALIIAIIIGATWYILANRGSDDEQQIRDVVTAETTALNNRDLAGLIGTRCSADAMLLQQQFTAQTFAAEVDSTLGPSGRWKVTVGAVRIDADAGTATAEQTTVPVGSGSIVAQTVTDTTTLRKESGGWKVCVSSSRVR